MEDKKLNIAIIGSRTIKDYNVIETKLLPILNKYIINNNIQIISGGAEGVDTLAEEFAKKHSIPIKILNADWNTFGNKAGFIRNDKLWSISDYVFMFWDGKSNGTSHGFELSKKHNVKYKLFVIEE